MAKTIKPPTNSPTRRSPNLDSVLDFARSDPRRLSRTTWKHADAELASLRADAELGRLVREAGTVPWLGHTAECAITHAGQPCTCKRDARQQAIGLAYHAADLAAAALAGEVLDAATPPTGPVGCSTCAGYGLWGMGNPSPMGPMDASEGYPTVPCPECGANANPQTPSRRRRP